jgi:recombination protein RecA
VSLTDTIKGLQKDHADAFENSDDLVGLSTGCLAVDLITGIGGFPRRRLTEVFGWEGSSKTTLCIAACAKAQRHGLFAAYVDVERGLDLVHAARLGFDYKNPKKGLYITPNTFEETMRIVTTLAETGECDLIIVDSVPGMVPEAELEGEITDVVQIGHRARLLASILPKLTKVIDKSNTALVLVNQMRYRIVTGWGAKFDHGPKEQASGGAALRFYSSLRVNMTLKKKGVITKEGVNMLTGKAEEIPIGNLHYCEAFKNKCAAPYRDLPFYLRYDPDGEYGMDNLQTVIMIAQVKGLFTKKGNHTAYKGEKYNFSVQGDGAVHNLLREKPEIEVEIRDTLGLPQED